MGYSHGKDPEEMECESEIPNQAFVNTVTNFGNSRIKAKVKLNLCLTKYHSKKR
jgi:hypothetical protein